MSRRRLALILSLILAFGSLPVTAAYRAPVCSRDGMAATPHSAATEAAALMLKKGGNAVDAALAAAFALAVVEPYHSGLGGGEFALVLPSPGGKIEALDARECAPSAAAPNLFLDSLTGEAHPTRSRKGGLAVGVPGSVAGRTALHQRYGKLPWKEVIEPAIRLARDGMIVDRYFADRLAGAHDAIAESPAAKVFVVNGKIIARGEKLVQPALAATLEQVARDRGEAFYRGRQGESLVGACQGAGGVLTAEDLANYRVIWREPVRFEYRGLEVISMPPPSSGGLCLAEILHILEPFPLGYLGQGNAETFHIIASAFERAFADRARWLADPAFVPQPVAGMSSKAYADKLRASIQRDRRAPVKEAGDPWKEAAGNTSHISVVDKEEGMCAITTSVNGGFGSLVFVPELGIFLNNTMDDFTISAKSANQFSLAQGEVNLIEPGKRPLSSMSPTLVLKEGRPYACLGSVGGPRIISSVALILINIADFGMDIQAAIDAPCLHMQWRPDTLFVENEFSQETVSDLTARGWNIARGGHWSIRQGVVIDRPNGLFYGGADARGVGTAGPADIP